MMLVFMLAVKRMNKGKKNTHVWTKENIEGINKHFKQLTLLAL